jgi:hypothetical protein
MTSNIIGNGLLRKRMKDFSATRPESPQNRDDTEAQSESEDMPCDESDESDSDLELSDIGSAESGKGIDERLLPGDGTTFNPLHSPSAIINIKDLLQETAPNQLRSFRGAVSNDRASIFNFEEITLPHHSTTLIHQFYKNLESPYIHKEFHEMELAGNYKLKWIQNTYDIIRLIADSSLWSVK